MGEGDEAFCFARTLMTYVPPSPFSKQSRLDPHCISYGRGSVNATTLVWEFVYSASGALPGTNASHPSSDDGNVVDRVVLTKGE